MQAYFNHPAAVLMRSLAICACIAGIWESLVMVRADRMFRRDTVDSVYAAIHLEPDAWEYYMRLAQLEDSRSTQALENALRLNVFNAQADIELGIKAEAAGDLVRAEKLLLQASTVDRTYVPRWTLAGFYLRHGNETAFWRWARKAVEMPAEHMGSLFELCWRVAPDANEVADRLLSDKPSPVEPDVLRQYVQFLFRKKELFGADLISERVIHTGEKSRDLPLLLEVIDQMLVTGDVDQALQLWHSAIDRGWVDGEKTVPFNSSFAHVPLPVAFDWRLISTSGIYSRVEGPGLFVQFTGGEPEDTRIVQQSIFLAPGSYIVDSEYWTLGIPYHSGLQWQIVDAKSEAVIATSPNLYNDSLTHMQTQFNVGAESKSLRLQLVYKRPVGTPRIDGSLKVLSIRIKHQ